MNLREKYLDITKIIKNKKENFGLFNVSSINNINEYFTNDRISAQNWMFTSDGKRKYDNNGVSLFDNNGKQLYDIDDNGFKIPLNTTNNLNNSNTMKQSYETNKNINNSAVNSSINKIFNNVSNNVIQSNLSIATASAGALNNIDIKNINCKNFTLSNIDQIANSNAQINSKVKQDSSNTISTNINNNIFNMIDKVKKSAIGDYSNENLNAINDVKIAFNLTDPIDATKLASDFGNAGLSGNNNINSSITNALNIDNSTTVKSETNINNIIKNNVNQDNVATCAANAAAKNNITLSDITCQNATISNVTQKAIATAIADCTFDQRTTSAINNNIQTQISSTFDQVYDKVLETVQKKYNPSQAAQAYKEYYDNINKLNTLGRLHAAVLTTTSCSDKYGKVDTNCLSNLQTPVAPAIQSPVVQAIPVVQAPSVPAIQAPSVPAIQTPSVPAIQAPVVPVAPVKTLQIPLPITQQQDFSLLGFFIMIIGIVIFLTCIGACENKYYSILGIPVVILGILFMLKVLP
jgi:hypothetical protein